MLQQVNSGGSICGGAGPGAAVCLPAAAMISDAEELKFNILIMHLIWLMAAPRLPPPPDVQADAAGEADQMGELQEGGVWEDDGAGGGVLRGQAAHPGGEERWAAGPSVTMVIVMTLTPASPNVLFMRLYCVTFVLIMLMRKALITMIIVYNPDIL